LIVPVGLVVGPVGIVRMVMLILKGQTVSDENGGLVQWQGGFKNAKTEFWELELLWILVLGDIGISRPPVSFSCAPVACSACSA
jgi:hypothetical protein